MESDLLSHHESSIARELRTKRAKATKQLTYNEAKKKKASLQSKRRFEFPVAVNRKLTAS